MPFHDPAIHEAGKSMHIEEGPAATVCDRHVVNLREMGRLARSREATAKANVGLQNIHRLLFYEFPKAPAMTFHLPRCQRYFCVRAKVCERPRIILLQGLLKPCNVAVFDRTAKHFGLYWIEQVIGVDHDIDVVTDGV